MTFCQCSVDHHYFSRILTSKLLNIGEEWRDKIMEQRRGIIGELEAVCVCVVLLSDSAPQGASKANESAPSNALLDGAPRFSCLGRNL
jgi:hypothetical protein